jgi:hypothetical protein
MDLTDVQQQLANLTAAIRQFEGHLTDQGVPLDLVSDFKSSIDDLRLRLWGILTARNAEDRVAFQDRFRLRRASEMCLQLGTELHEGRLRADPQELAKLLMATRHLDAAARGASHPEGSP